MLDRLGGESNWMSRFVNEFWARKLSAAEVPVPSGSQTGGQEVKRTDSIMEQTNQHTRSRYYTLELDLFAFLRHLGVQKK